MRTNNSPEIKLPNKKLVELINEQLDEIKKTKKDDYSFIYLEGNTLNLLLQYLMQNGDSFTNEVEQETSFHELLEELDTVLINTKKEFEEILSLLKRNS